MFIDHLVMICREIKRVLKKSGSFYLNIGDTYYGSGGAGGDYNIGGIREGQPKYKQGKVGKSNWLQPKQLLGIPERVMIALQNDGWILRNKNVWHKINSMPSCLHPDTKVFVKRECIKQISISEIEIGDSILSPTGWKEVKNKWVVEQEGIEFQYGTTGKIIAGKRHRFPISHDNRRKNYDIVMVKCIKEDKQKTQRVLFKPICDFLDGAINEDEYDQGKFFGIIIAEGGFNSKYPQGKITLNKNENELMEWFISILKKRYKLRNIQHKYKENYQYCQFYSYKVRKEYSEICGGSCVNKRLNREKILNSIYSFRKGLFDGIIEGDGHIDKSGRIIFGSASKQLRDDVGLLSSSINLLYSKHESHRRDKRTNKIYDAYFLTIPVSLQKEICKGETIKNHYHNIRVKKNYPSIYKNVFSTKTLKCVKVKELEKQKMIDIEVEDDLFIIADGLVSHNSVKDRLNNTWEPVFHFVRSRKYYYDLDAIREPHKESSLERAKYDFNLIPRAWEQEVIPVSGGKKVNIDCHPAGKNPGDILEYDSKYKDGGHGQTLQGFTRVQSIAKERTQSREDAKRLFPNNPKKQQEYINYIHDHGGHPMGPNPGDVVATREIKNKSYKSRDPGRHINPKGRNPGDVIKQGMHHGSSLSNKATHYEKSTVKLDPNGANPGDVIQFDEQYWWSFILGRAHTNKFYKKAYELMKNWMVKNNCFDYEIFYEWYKKEFEGKWESGTLERGKANYLSDEKRLPFPKPETRFLGDMPSDFWSITTQPFTGYNPDLEHFAVFPENLIIKPLKASCPKEICKKCGKPRIRITKTDNPSKTDFNRDSLVKASEVQKTSNPQSIKSLHRNPSPDGKAKGVYYSGKTVGWSDCGCGAGFDSGVVLDPFAGRGTVGKVAKQLGLHYILFDIKPEYCELARLYIGGQKHKLHKGQSKLNV